MLGKSKGHMGVQEMGKEKGIEKVYTTCWNNGKSSRLTSVDEKKSGPKISYLQERGQSSRFTKQRSLEAVLTMACMRYNTSYD